MNLTFVLDTDRTIFGESQKFVVGDLVEIDSDVQCIDMAVVEG